MGVWLILVVALAAGFYLVGGGDALSGIEGGEVAWVLAGAALVALYIYSLRYDYRGRAGQAIRHVVVWAGLFLAVVTGYAYRDVLTQAAQRVGGELAPAGTAFDVSETASGERSVRLRRRLGGQFGARLNVNDTPVTMLVDTGASTIVLKPADAEKAGIDVGRLAYTVPVDTANGTTFAAPVRLKSISIGPIEVRDVEALVARPGNLKESLLGMTFLKRLRSYEFSGEYLTLRG